MHLISFRVDAVREGADARNARPGSACSSRPRQLWVTNVARVWCWYLVHGTPRAASVRAASAAAAKAPGASEAPLCKACCNMEKLGKKNGEAHLRVPPCTWVRKAPAPRKKRALKTPVAVAVAEREAELAPAVTCSCVRLVGLTQSSGSPPVLRQDKQTTARDACTIGL